MTKPHLFTIHVDGNEVLVDSAAYLVYRDIHIQHEAIHNVLHSAPFRNNDPATIGAMVHGLTRLGTLIYAFAKSSPTGCMADVCLQLLKRFRVTSNIVLNATNSIPQHAKIDYEQFHVVRDKLVF